MRLQAVHTCPLWEEPDGTRRPGLEEEDPHPLVVGWCNVLVIDMGGELRWFLAVYEGDDE